VIVGLRPGLVDLRFSLSLRFTRRCALAGVLVLATVAGARAAQAPPLETVLSSRGIRDPRVLDAFAAVPRDAFVPADAGERASDDKPLPPGPGQAISQPYPLARLIEALQLQPEARVLEVGTGSGYAAAVLSRLAREVFSVGVIPEMAATARLRLAREGYQNIHVKVGDGAAGWREYGPYDAIVVTSIGPRVPAALVDQLVENGVLVMIVGPANGRQVLLRGIKKGFKLHAKEVAELRPSSADGRALAPAPQGRRNPPADDVRERRPARDSDEPRIDR